MIWEGDVAGWRCAKEAINYSQYYFSMHTDLEVSFQGQVFNTEEHT